LDTGLINFDLENSTLREAKELLDVTTRAIHWDKEDKIFQNKAIGY